MAESTVRIGVTTNTGQAEAGIKSVKGLLQGLGAEAKKSILTGVGLAGGLAAFQAIQGAAGAAVNYLGDAVQAASSFNESQSKAQVVFGASAKSIEAWARTAATSMGMSNQAALEAAGTYGNLFQAFGLGQEEATSMSKTLVQLAADLASFNNTSVDDALVALRSGLSGETEPLKRYGIALSDARMRTELMRQGVKDLGATLTPLQKTQAAYALILKDSTLAQGDFSRTSDGLANSQKKLEAEMADLSVQVGQMLLPIIKDLTHFAANELIPALKNVTQAVADAKPVWEALGWIIGRTADGIKIIAGPILLAGDLLETVLPKAAKTGMDNTAAALREGTSASERALIEGGPKVKTATGLLMKPMSEETKKAVADAIATIREMPGKMAAALRDGRKAWQDALALLGTDIENSTTRTARLAALWGALTGKELARGLKSSDIVVRLQAQYTQNLIVEQLKMEGEPIAQWGANIGYTWASGLRSGLYQGLTPVHYVLSQYSGMLEGFSPPKTGPLKNIDKGAFNVGQAWAKGFNKGLAGLEIPQMPGMSGPARQLAPGGGGLGVAALASNGGVTHYHFEPKITIEGDVRARDKEELTAVMARLFALSSDPSRIGA